MKKSPAKNLKAMKSLAEKIKSLQFKAPSSQEEHILTVAIYLASVKQQGQHEISFAE
jgi:hypothetical protein